MLHVNVVEAIAHLPELLEAASNGESVLIVNERQQAIAQLGPLDAAEQHPPVPKFGSAAGQLWMADDFDAPLDDFADYQ